MRIGGLDNGGTPKKNSADYEGRAYYDRNYLPVSALANPRLLGAARQAHPQSVSPVFVLSPRPFSKALRPPAWTRKTAASPQRFPNIQERLRFFGNSFLLGRVHLNSSTARRRRSVSRPKFSLFGLAVAVTAWPFRRRRKNRRFCRRCQQPFLRRFRRRPRRRRRTTPLAPLATTGRCRRCSVAPRRRRPRSASTPRSRPRAFSRRGSERNGGLPRGTEEVVDP